MDVEGFLSGLPRLFDDYPESPEPRDPYFASVLDEVDALARPNNLALLGQAVSRLEPGESYVEIGSWLGASLVGAMHGNEGRDAVAIDRFGFRGATRADLEANLRRFDVTGVTVLEGDALELLAGGALDGRRVGVLYYDASHDREDTLRALELAAPHLAARALVLVDDSDWDDVRGATADWLAAEPRAKLVLELPGKDRGSPHWWEGVQAIAWAA